VRRAADDPIPWQQHLVKPAATCIADARHAGAVVNRGAVASVAANPVTPGECVAADAAMVSTVTRPPKMFGTVVRLRRLGTVRDEPAVRLRARTGADATCGGGNCERGHARSVRR